MKSASSVGTRPRFSAITACNSLGHVFGADVKLLFSERRQRLRGACSMSASLTFTGSRRRLSKIPDRDAFHMRFSRLMCLWRCPRAQSRNLPCMSSTPFSSGTPLKMDWIIDAETGVELESASSSRSRAKKNHPHQRLHAPGHGAEDQVHSL